MTHLPYLRPEDINPGDRVVIDDTGQEWTVDEVYRNPRWRDPYVAVSRSEARGRKWIRSVATDASISSIRRHTMFGEMTMF